MGNPEDEEREASRQGRVAILAEMQASTTDVLGERGSGQRWAIRKGKTHRRAPLADCAGVAGGEDPSPTGPPPRTVPVAVITSTRRREWADIMSIWRWLAEGLVELVFGLLTFAVCG